MDPVTIAGLILTAISDSNNARHDMEGDSVVAQCPAEEGQQETSDPRTCYVSVTGHS